MKREMIHLVLLSKRWWFLAQTVAWASSTGGSVLPETSWQERSRTGR
jgi:hypothetical protein